MTTRIIFSAGTPIRYDADTEMYCTPWNRHIFLLCNVLYDVSHGYSSMVIFRGIGCCSWCVDKYLPWRPYTPNDTAKVLTLRATEALSTAALRFITSNSSWHYRPGYECIWQSILRCSDSLTELRLALKAGTPTAYVVPRLIEGGGNNLWAR